MTHAIADAVRRYDQAFDKGLALQMQKLEAEGHGITVREAFAAALMQKAAVDRAKMAADPVAWLAGHRTS